MNIVCNKDYLHIGTDISLEDLQTCEEDIQEIIWRNKGLFRVIHYGHIADMVRYMQHRIDVRSPLGVSPCFYWEQAKPLQDIDFRF